MILGSFSRLINILQTFICETTPGVKSFSVGTFASQNPLRTTNTAMTTVKALWHFTENWLTGFPEYKSTSKEISVWTNLVSICLTSWIHLY